jgi:hypothetical protein
MDNNEYLEFLTEGWSFAKKSRLFHLSTELRKHPSGIDPYFQPAIPSNDYTAHGYEEADIKRISVAPDVDHCLLALGESVLRGRALWYVYEVKDYNDIKPITTQELLNKGWVLDAKQTKESWLLTFTQFKLLGFIKVLRKSNKFEVVPDFRKKIHGHAARSRKDRRIYYYDWKLVKGKI